jgi:hypothetical protein
MVASLVGRKLDAQVDTQWLWKGRRVYVFDGSTVSMSDTPENRREYPLTYNQRPGSEFPVARIGAIISVACGAIVNLGSAVTPGKAKASWGCCASCGACFAAATSWWGRLRLTDEPRLGTLIILSRRAPQPSPGDSAVALPTTTALTGIVRAQERSGDTPPRHIPPPRTPLRGERFGCMRRAF